MAAAVAADRTAVADGDKRSQNFSEPEEVSKNASAMRMG
jgi:hypothetical protein